MGWWSCTVLGGDTPLDWLGDLANVMGVDYDQDKKSEDGEGIGYYGYNYTRELLEAKRDEMVSKIENSKYDKGVGFQVLAAMMLQAGAEIPAGLKHKMVLAANQDEWANNADEGAAPERKAYMKDLVEKVLAHETGTKTELAVEGLMQKIAEHLG